MARSLPLQTLRALALWCEWRILSNGYLFCVIRTKLQICFVWQMVFLAFCKRTVDGDRQSGTHKSYRAILYWCMWGVETVMECSYVVMHPIRNHHFMPWYHHFLTSSLLFAIRCRTMIISELCRIIGWFWVAQAKKCILCTMYVRKKHNRSGSTSVVVVSIASGKYREIKSGSSEIWSGA